MTFPGYRKSEVIFEGLVYHLWDWEMNYNMKVFAGDFERLCKDIWKKVEGLLDFGFYLSNTSMQIDYIPDEGLSVHVAKMIGRGYYDKHFEGLVYMNDIDEDDDDN